MSRTFFWKWKIFFLKFWKWKSSMEVENENYFKEVENENWKSKFFYHSNRKRKLKMAPRAGLEPATHGLTVHCATIAPSGSIRWARFDSNERSTDYESVALTTMLQAQKKSGAVTQSWTGISRATIWRTKPLYYDRHI